jgi:hypothetical protein
VARAYIDESGDPEREGAFLVLGVAVTHPRVLERALRRWRERWPFLGWPLHGAMLRSGPWLALAAADWMSSSELVDPRPELGLEGEAPAAVLRFCEENQLWEEAWRLLIWQSQQASGPAAPDPRAAFLREARLACRRLSPPLAGRGHRAELQGLRRWERELGGLPWSGRLASGLSSEVAQLLRLHAGLGAVYASLEAPAAPATPDRYLRHLGAVARGIWAEQPQTALRIQRRHLEEPRIRGERRALNEADLRRVAGEGPVELCWMDERALAGDVVADLLAGELRRLRRHGGGAADALAPLLLRELGVQGIGA